MSNKTNWILCNNLEQAAQSFPEGEIITFGDPIFSQIPLQDTAKIIAQATVDCGIIFLRLYDNVHISLDNLIFKAAKIEFRIQASSFENEFFNFPITELEITNSFRDPIFIKALFEVRQDGMKSLSSSIKNINSIAQKSVFFLTHYWFRNDPFCEREKKIFLNYIWCIIAQICFNGVLTKLLNDDSISEIMVSDPFSIYIEKLGKIRRTALEFPSAKELLGIIEKLVTETGRRVDESQPYCDARLKDGSRLHVILPPLALNGPCLTIRRFPKHSITAEDLLKQESLAPGALQIMQNAVKEKKNILICGGTGSGKTTILNALSASIDSQERIITIEDSAELRLLQPHVIRLEARGQNIEGKGEITLRELLRNALRMRPNRIIVGECRGGEALDMLQAMNTGHAGSLTTIHANSPKDALHRLEVLVMYGAEQLPHKAIREQVASGINMVIHVKRLGPRRIVESIFSLDGLCAKTDSYKLNLLSKYPEEEIT